MVNPNTFSIEDWEKWFTLKILEKTDITDADLLDILGDKRIARIQELQLAKKIEQSWNWNQRVLNMHLY